MITREWRSSNRILLSKLFLLFNDRWRPHLNTFSFNVVKRRDLISAFTHIKKDKLLHNIYSKIIHLLENSNSFENCFGSSYRWYHLSTTDDFSLVISSWNPAPFHTREISNSINVITFVLSILYFNKNINLLASSYFSKVG
jgi:hypothetical protein